MSAADSLPDDIATLKAMLVAERAARIEAEAKVRSAEAKAHARALEIAKLKFVIAKLRHQRFGQSAERGARCGRVRECERPDGPAWSETLACADAPWMGTGRSHVWLAMGDHRSPRREGEEP
jgi:hypothetical protein